MRWVKKGGRGREGEERGGHKFERGGVMERDGEEAGVKMK